MGCYPYQVYVTEYHFHDITAFIPDVEMTAALRFVIHWLPDRITYVYINAMLST